MVEDGERAGTDREGGGAKPSSVISFSSKYLWDAYVPGTILIIQDTQGAKLTPGGSVGSTHAVDRNVTRQIPGTSLAVQWLTFRASNAGGLVPPLAGDLRCLMLPGLA